MTVPLLSRSLGTRTFITENAAGACFTRVDGDVGRGDGGQGEDGGAAATAMTDFFMVWCSLLPWSAETEGPGLGLDVAVGVSQRTVAR